VLFHQDFRNPATRVSKALCHHRLISVSVVVGAKASGVTKSISKCTLMARVFEDEVSILRSAKLDLLVYTDEIGSAGAAMLENLKGPDEVGRSRGRLGSVAYSRGCEKHLSEKRFVMRPTGKAPIRCFLW